MKKEAMKDGFFSIIQKFLQQAEEGNKFTVNTYSKEYEDLQVKVSSGKGKQTRIPQMAFLFEGQTTNNGIYPVFLYYKEQSLLILSYGISETHRPVQRWILPNDVQTISSYFRSNGFGAPERYGDSYRYAISLLTKPFVILSGLSGSGKTRLALTFAKWLSRDDSQVKIVSVGADWNNREYLLGYPNALDCGKYIKPEKHS